MRPVQWNFGELLEIKDFCLLAVLIDVSDLIIADEQILMCLTALFFLSRLEMKAQMVLNGTLTWYPIMEKP